MSAISGHAGDSIMWNVLQLIVHQSIEHGTSEGYNIALSVSVAPALRYLCVTLFPVTSQIMCSEA